MAKHAFLCSINRLFHKHSKWRSFLQRWPGFLEWNYKAKNLEKEFSTRASLPYFEDCSLELCSYAYSITGRERASTVSKEDMNFLHPEKIKAPKFIFGAANDLSNSDKVTYRGCITEEEFTKLLTLALRDIKQISADIAKTRTV